MVRFLPEADPVRVEHAGPAERLKQHSRNNICSFYQFELKVYRMVELCIRNNFKCMILNVCKLVKDFIDS